MLWKPKRTCNKVKRQIVTQDILKGGLKILDIYDFVCSLKCSWIKRLTLYYKYWMDISLQETVVMSNDDILHNYNLPNVYMMQFNSIVSAMSKFFIESVSVEKACNKKNPHVILSYQCILILYC